MQDLALVELLHRSLEMAARLGRRLYLQDIDLIVMEKSGCILQ
jgi:hypothetical protein